MLKYKNEDGQEVYAVQYVEGQTSINNMKIALRLGASQVLPIIFESKGVFFETIGGRVVLDSGFYIAKQDDGLFYVCEPTFFNERHKLIEGA